MSTQSAKPDTLRPLVDRYVTDGDEAAIELLVKETRPRLLAAARKIGRPSDADDAVQVAYLSLIRRLSTPMDAPIFPWLLTATLRVAYRKKAATQRQHDIARALALETPHSASVRQAPDDIRTIVRDHLTRLPDIYRDVLYLHYIAQLPQDEVARLLDVPVATVRTRLHRGRTLLHSRMPTRLRSALCAAPWWAMDHATGALSAIGGMVVAKKTTMAVATIALLTAVGGGVWFTLRDQPDVPKANETAQRDEGDLPAGTPPVVAAASLRAAPTAASPVPASPTAASDFPVFRGRVVDGAGKPVVGAEITVDGSRVTQGTGDDGSIAAQSVRLARTDKGGSFSLPHRGVARSTSTFRVDIVTEAYGMTIAQLHPDQPNEIVLGAAGKVAVTVRDPSGIPVTAATVSLIDGDEVFRNQGHHVPAPIRSLRTDARGHVGLGVPDGRYALRVTADGYPSMMTESLAHSANKPLAHTFTLAEGSRVGVRVVDEKGQPIEGAQVMIGAPRNAVSTLTTNAEGRVQQRGFPASPDAGISHYLERCVYYFISAPGFASADGYRPLPSSAGVLDFEVRLVRGQPLVVVVRDDVGTPLSKAQVSVMLDRNASNPLTSRRSIGALTDDRGRADLGLLSSRRNRLTVRAASSDQYEWFHGPVTFPANGDLEVVLHRKGASVRGRALGPKGEVVKDLEVCWSPASQDTYGIAMARTVPVDAQGVFHLPGLVGGEGQLVLRAPGIVPQTTSLSVEPGEQVEGVEAEFTLDGRIHGRLTLRDGTPVPDANVSLWLQYKVNGATSVWKAVEVTSDVEGRFVFRGATTDRKYSLRVNSKGLIDTTPFPERMHQRSDQEVLVVLKPESERDSVAFRVRLTSGGSEYKGPATILWDRDKAGRPKMATDAKVPESGVRAYPVWSGPGTHEFEIKAPGHLPYHTGPVRIIDSVDAPIHDIALDRGAVVRLRVLREGKPLSNAAVSAFAVSLINQEVTHHGNTRSTTDAEGHCTISGLPSDMKMTLSITLLGDQYTSREFANVVAPTELDFDVRRHGMYSVTWPVRYGDLTVPLTLRLLDASGEVIEQKTIERRSGVWAKGAVAGWFRIYTPGRYRMVAIVDGETYTHEADVMVGATVRGTAK